MSGGVDSSVAAALLKKQGYFVIGVFMKFWSDSSAGKKNANRCCSVESEKMARLVAQQLEIPFYVLNVEKEFKKKVVDYFLAEYKKGNTPNPCVVCNKEIKFGLLVERALKMGAGFVATGHYARTQLANKPLRFRSPNDFFLRREPLCGAPTPRKNYLARLLRGRDRSKDQSYFLWQLKKEQLKNILFPVGGYTKPQVRKLAEKFKLPTAQTPESQEVCFISGTVNDFLKKYFQPKAGSPRAKKTKPGKIIDISGKELGEHQGLWFYTIGQRRGLEIPCLPAGRHKGPWYVVRKDYKANTLIVSKNIDDLLQKEFIAQDVNWASPQKFPLSTEVKIRYKSHPSKAKILALEKGGIFSDRKKTYQIIFSKPQSAITPGQSAVFYKGEELLGGGIIQ